MSEKICPNCNGFGVVGEDQKVCDYCVGEGRVSLNTPD